MILKVINNVDKNNKMTLPDMLFYGNLSATGEWTILQ